ncbi:MAG: hypothetical protein WAT67_04250 [Candidatus Contendobacter sp.]
MTLDRRHVIGGVLAAFAGLAAKAASAQPAAMRGWNCTGALIPGPDKKPFCTQWTRQGGSIGVSGPISPPPAVVGANAMANTPKKAAGKKARRHRRRRRRH